MEVAERGTKILSFQNLYKRYSGLALSRDTDRPWAINGLQERIYNALDAKGGYGVFIDETRAGRRRGLLRRSLLWRRGDNIATLDRIQFPSGGAIGKVPSWSWMAHTGAIDYIAPDFATVEWEPVQTEWDSEPDKSSEGVLVAYARDYTTNGDATAFFDCPQVSQQPDTKCVVLGRNKATMPDGHKMHYVLLVQETPNLAHDGSKAYERVGAGVLPGKCVGTDSVKISIH